MTETLANGYSNERTQRELSNEYQHDRVLMVFKDLSVLGLWIKVASALEGLQQWLFLSQYLTFIFAREAIRRQAFFSSFYPVMACGIYLYAEFE